LNQQNFIRVFFEECIIDYVRSLEDIGLSMDQIFVLLPEAASEILNVTQKTSMYQAISYLLSGGRPHLKRCIDIDSMANKLELNSEQVQAGLCAIAPILLEDFFHKGKSFIWSGIGDRRKPDDLVNSTIKLA